MFSFFRQIRKTLMDQNKVRTYLLYAIGEILLVMIGILLALQVNNWNEQNKQEAEEQATLLNLLSDMNSNKAQLDSKIDVANKDIQNIIELVAIDPSDMTISEDYIDSLYVEISSPPTFDPNEANIKEIINSGKINLISNDSLKLNILMWEGTLQEVRELQQVIRVTNRDELLMISEYILIRPSYKDELGASEFRSSSRDLLRTKKNENYLTIKFRRYEVLLSRYEQLNTLISDMIRHINTELQT